MSTLVAPSLDISVRLSYCTYILSASDLDLVLSILRESKKTGSLTIHFSQGTPSGSMEWKEKSEKPLTIHSSSSYR